MNHEALEAALANAEAIVVALRLALAGRDAGPRWIDTGTAMRISGKSHSWVTKHARREGYGHKPPGCAWLIDEGRFRAFVGGYRANEENDDRAKCVTRGPSASES